jgi:hypothetical protein
MRYHGAHLVLATATLAAVATAALPQSAQEGVTAYIEGGRKAVIAFVPPSLQDPQDKRAVESAIERTKRCLGADKVSYEVVSADRIVVRSGEHEEAFQVHDFAPLVGALLLRPGSNARILFAGGGPEALAQVLRSAASDYFGRSCKAG